MSDMPYMADNSSSLSHEQVVEAYLQAKRLIDSYPFLHFLVKIPYTDVIPAVIDEQLHAVSSQELVAGLNMLLQECFAGLRELTGDLIAPPLLDEVTRQLGQIP